MAIKIENQKAIVGVPENLKTTSFLRLPKENEQEGVDFLNISLKSTTQLGKELHPNYSRTFNTVLGKVASVRNFISLITIPGYPIDLVAKRNLKPEEQGTIPKERITPVNYWALVAYAMCERILQDKVVRNQLQKSNAWLTAFDTYEAPSLFKGRTNLNRNVNAPVLRMANYIAILRAICIMIKENKFNRENISEFIEQCKADPDRDAFEGVPEAIKEMLNSQSLAVECDQEADVVSMPTEAEETTGVEPEPEAEEPETPKKGKKSARKAEAE